MIGDPEKWVHVRRVNDGWHILLGSELNNQRPMLIAAFGPDQQDAARTLADTTKVMLKELAASAYYDGASAEREGRYEDEPYVEETSDRASMRVGLDATFRRVRGEGGHERLVGELESPFGVCGTIELACDDERRDDFEGRMKVDLRIEEPIVLGEAESAALLTMIGAIHAATEVRLSEETKKRN